MKARTKTLTSKQIRYLKENYPDVTNEELAQRLGVSVWTVKARAYRHRLRKSREFLSGQRSLLAVKYNNAKNLNTPESRTKRNKTLRLLYKEEKERALAGYPQKTKRHVSVKPRQMLMQKNYLQRRGYIVNDAIRVAYYTPATRRSPRVENVPRDTCKGNIRAYYDFWPLPEDYKNSIKP